jgi:lipopolysaccharide export system protein LptA
MLQPITSRTRHTPLRQSGVLLLALSCGMLATSVYALDSDREQPVHLEADHATYNQQSGVTVYTGNVILTQGTIRVEADTVTANLDDARSIKDVTALGKPAKFQQKVSPDKGIVYGEGSKVFYEAGTAKITLTGKAKITQDSSSFNGNTLTYTMKQGNIEAAGGPQQRVQMVIPPSATKPAGN